MLNVEEGVAALVDSEVAGRTRVESLLKIGTTDRYLSAVCLETNFRCLTIIVIRNTHTTYAGDWVFNVVTELGHGVGVA